MRPPGGYALGTTITVTGQPLVNFIQSRASDGGLVTFILKNDDATDRGYGICSKEYADEAYRLTLELTVVTGPKTDASNPRPEDKATDVLRDVVLSWKAGASATVGEQSVNGPAALTTGWHHVAVVIDSATMRLQLYQDGTPAASGATTLLPKDLGVTTQNWLGRSQWTTDPFFGGSMDEFRVYNRALSESEVRYLAGDR